MKISIIYSCIFLLIPFIGNTQADTNITCDAEFQNVIFISGDSTYHLYRVPPFITGFPVSDLYKRGWFNDVEDINCNVFYPYKSCKKIVCSLNGKVDTVYNLFSKNNDSFEIINHNIKDIECIEDELVIKAELSYILNHLGFKDLDSNNLYFVSTFIPNNKSYIKEIRKSSIAIEIKNFNILNQKSKINNKSFKMLIKTGGIFENSDDTYTVLDSFNIEISYKKVLKVYKMLNKSRKHNLNDCTCSGLNNLIIFNNWKSIYSYECMNRYRPPIISYYKSDIIGLNILNLALKNAPFLNKKLAGATW